ncbi:MAG TPA: response regulator [Rhizomicrobium sp.]|nr:response regulator [Rhizomicrobium sp.]
MQGARILYIDDDEGLVRLVTRTLERRGAQVFAAYNGLEGLQKAASDSFDIIVLDHHMPGQNGLDVLIQLRATTPDIPVVFVTGSGESQVAVSALKAGAADYLAKTGDGEFLTLLESSVLQSLENIRLKARKAEAEEETRKTNAQLQAMVERQAILLREVNHRVANSLQLVSSLVQMQANATDSPIAKAVLRDTQQRIRAIGQVHRRLYTSEQVESVEICEYVNSLLEELRASWDSTKIHLKSQMPSAAIMVRTDIAVSLGVIVVELVTNALKYAYPNDEKGEVRVRIDKAADGQIRLEVQDDGRGASSQDLKGTTGLGQKVIRAMAAGLHGTVEVESSERGVTATLQFMPS